MALINPYTTTPRTRQKTKIIFPIVVLAIILYYYKDFFVLNTIPRVNNNNRHHGQHDHDDKRTEHGGRHEPQSHSTVNDQHYDKGHQQMKQEKKSSKSNFIPTLRNKKIFFEVATVGLKQFSYLEDIIDSVRDMCEAGAHVSFHITSSNCNPHPKDDEGECVIRNQSSNDTKEDNFNAETISHLNEKVRCRNPEGSLDMSIHLVSPDWG